MDKSALLDHVVGLAAAENHRVIRAEFGFDPAAPLVVSLVLVVEGGPRVLWRIGRDLMQQGLRSAGGLGDVQMWPARADGEGTAWLQLASRDMAALFELPAPPAEGLAGAHL
ncbi:SsgA family sporulation/cell division regulator [Streptomyces griseorubiginosus]|uniref:SsgA family sporulation/cell division regulator n=1 Tax=Streptomyces griseorubiginosus TaxID=67304 RepID=UPI00367EBE16